MITIQLQYDTEFYLTNDLFKEGQVPRIAIRIIRGKNDDNNKTYQCERNLKEIGLFSLAKERLRDITANHKKKSIRIIP